MNRFTNMLGAAFAVAFSLGQPALAQDWEPSGPVRMMIAFGAGGATDSIARMLAQEISDRHGWQIIPENVPGRGGVNMGVALKDEPNDGMSIGITTDNSLAYNRLAEPTPPFEVSDFSAITTITGAQSSLIALSSRGWTTFQDVIDYAKAGNKVTLGVDAPRLADGLYLLSVANGFEFVSVTVDGGRAGMDAVMGGDVDVSTAGGGQLPGVEAGDLVELLNMSPVPLKGRENLQNMTDYNVDFTLGALFMAIAPAGIPDEARETWAKVIGDIVADPESQTNELINRTFSGASIIALGDLDTHLQELNEGSLKLLEASSQ